MAVFLYRAPSSVSGAYHRQTKTKLTANYLVDTLNISNLGFSLLVHDHRFALGWYPKSVQITKSIRLSGYRTVLAQLWMFNVVTSPLVETFNNATFQKKCALSHYVAVTGGRRRRVNRSTLSFKKRTYWPRLALHLLDHRSRRNLRAFFFFFSIWNWHLF